MGEINTETENNSAKRIVKNTLFLYFRQILIMVTSLYTVRVILAALGATDYGVYNVVAGVVSILSFLSGTMANTSQRYFSYDLGKKEFDNLNKTFSLTVTIYLILVIIFLVLSETIGLWYVCYRLSVPDSRFFASKIIYQFSILSLCFTLMTTPFMAIIIAHENMSIYAAVSIIEALLKLVVAFSIKFFHGDKLIFYGFLMMIVTIVNTTIYRSICKRKYKECKYRLYWNKRSALEMFAFVGWSLFGSFSSVARTQGLTILVNQYFSPLVVTARTISSQITNALTVFSAKFNTSLYAPIVKDFASNRKENMFQLMYNGCKMSFFLMWIFSLPLVLRMEYVLNLWLKDIPEYIVVFSILSIIEVLITSLSYPLTTVARANGKVKLYESVLGIFQLMIFVCSYIGLKYYAASPVSIFYISIIFNLLMLVARIILLNYLVKLPVIKYIKIVILPIVLIFIISLVPTYFINKMLTDSFISLVLIIILSFFLSSIAMYIIGIDSYTRKKIMKKIKNFKIRM